jgi:uridine kinase
VKTALLIAGYLRSFKVNLPLIKDRVLDKFKDIDIYIHITKNETKNDKYFNMTNEVEDISYIKNILNPKSILLEDNLEIFDNPKENNLHNTWIKYYKLNEIKKINEKLYGEYDLVIKYRPDLNITMDEIFPKELEDKIYIPEKSLIDKSKLENPNDNYMCDIFAYGKSKLMDQYFNIYNNLEQLSKKYGYTPETIIYEHLNKEQIPYKLIDLEYSMILSMCNTFAICGDSGSGKSTLSNILQEYFSNSFVLECDRYHKWERNDENWKKFTHLNPEANYITKMENDIFDLKIGKTIHQVNYDHSNGKFTQKEKIEKSDNIIVCGLHSLYSENHGAYNLKIFIDTDINLKTKWKIKRDMQNRGYSIEETLKQIEARKEDYYKYIYPQRDKSDIIINFFTDKDFDINKINEDDTVNLRILINKKYSLIDILSHLSKKEIEFKIKSNNEIFNEIVFYKYKKCNILENSNISFDNYYDYIMFFILSLQQNH